MPSIYDDVEEIFRECKDKRNQVKLLGLTHDPLLIFWAIRTRIPLEVRAKVPSLYYRVTLYFFLGNYCGAQY